MKEKTITFSADLGTTSSAVAVIERDNKTNKCEIKEVIEIITPFNDIDKFISGNANFETPAAGRRNLRLSRRNKETKHRIQKRLISLLKKIFGWNKSNENFDILSLKIEGQSRKLTLPELCAVIFNFSKYRGYSFDVSDLIEDSSLEDAKEISDYKKGAQKVITWCKNNNKTLSHYFKENDLKIHTRNQDNPVSEYLNRQELKLILENQKGFYAQLTDDVIDELFKVIYFKKKKSSCKHLVGNCVFEKDKKVGNKSNPIYQLFILWQKISDIIVTDSTGEESRLSGDEKIEIIKILTTEKDELTALQIIKILKRGQDINFKSIPGAKTIIDIKKTLPDANIEQIQDIWHKIYSHDSSSVIYKCLTSYGLTNEQAETLSKIVLKKDYGNISEKAIKKILPYMNGEKSFRDFYESSKLVFPEYYETEIIKSKYIDKIKPNSLRNPVVEKTLNQTFKIFNTLIDKYGNPDTTVIEMARELKSSKKKRAETTKRNTERSKQKQNISETLLKYGVRPNFNKLLRVTLWMEQGGRIDFKNLTPIKNAIEVYTGEEITFQQAVNSATTELEHTLTESRFFDSSKQYLTLSFSDTNSKKEDRTALEFVSEDFSASEQKRFFERINKIYKGNKGKIKTFSYGYKKMPKAIPTNQATMTGYITKKASQEFAKICDTIIFATGGITDFIKKKTGLFDAFLELIKEETDKHGLPAPKDKRRDRRHHALDALVLATVTYKDIQSINNMNSFYEEQKGKEQILRTNLINKIIYEKEELFDNGFVNAIIDGVKNTLVLEKRAKSSVFSKNGAKGVRGAIHEQTALKQSKTIPVFENGKLNKKINIDNVYSESIKKVIEQYESVTDAFSKNPYLKKLEVITIKLINNKKGKIVDADNVVEINGSFFQSGTNVKIDVFKNTSNDTYRNVRVSLYDIASGNCKNNTALEDEVFVNSFHKRDYLVLGLSEEEISKVLTISDFEKISNNLFYICKIDKDGTLYLQKHFNEPVVSVEVEGNKVPRRIFDATGTYSSLVKKHKDIVKMKIKNNGEISIYSVNKVSLDL